MIWIFSWFVLLLAIPGVQATTCTMGDDDSWHASLLLVSPLAFLALLIIWFSRQHHTKFVFFSLPLALILPYCFIFAWDYLVGTTFQGRHLCSVLTGSDFDSYVVDPWSRYWAPVAFLLAGAYMAVAVFCWRKWFIERRAVQQ
jgi:hypothetical protein